MGMHHKERGAQADRTDAVPWAWTLPVPNHYRAISTCNKCLFLYGLDIALAYLTLHVTFPSLG